MIYMWFIGINYYKLAIEKDRDYFYDHYTTISQGFNFHNPHTGDPIIYIL